jgi:hypothetical protein
MDEQNSLVVAEKSHKADHLKQYKFPPGKSGNPGGRPKLPPELKKAFKPAITFVAELIENKAEDTNQRRLAAADVIAYHLGKPGAELLDDSDENISDDVVIRALDRVAQLRPHLAKDLAKLKKKLESEEGAAQCVEESQP